jgi:CelD/BcsL family acetyltransferase involved in cellulose biosynthesis
MKRVDDRTSSAAGSASVACIEDTAGFRALRREWADLHTACPYATPFNSWDWLFSWWQAYGGPQLLRILTFRSGPTLIGVAPFFLASERTDIGVRCRVLRLIGDGSFDSDYLGILAARDSLPHVADLLVQWLRDGSGWDALVLREMSTASNQAATLQPALQRAGLRTRLETGRTALLDLPASFDEFLHGRRARFRTKIRSLLKGLDAAGIMLETRCERPLQLRTRLRSLYALHQQRWTASGEAGVFANAARRSFYRRFVPRFERRGWLRLYSLRSGNDYVAHQLCFGGNGVTYLLQEGFDTSQASASYGQMLRAAVMRHLIQSGERHYDFLGGFSRHKEEWGAREEPSHHLTAARSTWRGRLYFALPAWRERLAPLKRFLPRPLLDRLRAALNASG